MADFVERAVRRMREDPAFSRNRHFLALSSPEGRRAVRIHRHLQSLEADLGRGHPVTVERHGARVCISVKYRGGTRVAWLAAGEFKLLCTSPIVRAALDAQPDPS
ncbi:MAG TPA: hypothetical protein VMK42_17800 [Anaeromyxobacteraceae bacterium]|nr:hypothetical protein [Anaeromyxobacteraceae bacterium]